MADLPILFSAPMVRALLREIEQPGTGKTQTRRLCGLHGLIDPSEIEWDASAGDFRWSGQDTYLGNGLPRYSVGDRLYVREAWRTESHAYNDLSPSEMSGEETVIFEADADWKLNKTVGRLRQGMHMPRWASRITLIVTDVRVQRLQDIREADARAEGGINVSKPDDLRYMGWTHGLSWHGMARESFRELWDSLNSERAPWVSNPWVAAYTFRPILGNIDQVRA